MTLSAISRIGRISRPWSSEKILPPPPPPENDGKLTCHLKRDHPKRQVVFTWLLPGVHPPKLTQPPKIGHPKRKFIFQPSIFRGELLVSGRVYTYSLPIQLLLNLQRLHYILHLKKSSLGTPDFWKPPHTSPRRNMPRKQPALSSWGKISGGTWLNICLRVGGFNPSHIAVKT